MIIQQNMNNRQYNLISQPTKKTINSDKIQPPASKGAELLYATHTLYDDGCRYYSYKLNRTHISKADKRYWVCNRI